MNEKVISFLLIVFCQSLLGQVWQKEAQFFSIGIGESATYKTVVEEEIRKAKSKHPGNYGSMKIKNTPCFFGKFEHSFSKRIGVGFVVAYRRTIVDQTINYSYEDTTVFYATAWGYTHPLKTVTDNIIYTTQDVSFGARFNIHFFDLKKIDPYIGIATGYRLIDHKLEQKSSNPNEPIYVVEYSDKMPVYFAATIGVRCFITNGFGIYTELGLDKWSIIQGGLIFKI